MVLKPWPFLHKEDVLETPVFNVTRQTFKSPKDGGDKPFTILETPDWVQVLPVTDEGYAILVQQYRFGTKEISLELPGGVVEKGQIPLEAAKRELMEETGYQAYQWRQMATFRPNPAVQNNRAHFFLAEKAYLAGSTCFDENEDIELIKVPLRELYDLIKDGKIDHVIMVAAILSYLQYREVN